MKVLVISHTYISAINRQKWSIFAKRYKDVSLHVLFPTYWPSYLFSHSAHIEQSEQYENCTFIAMETFKAGNELLYHYKHHQLFKLIASLKPDIIHVEQGAGALSYFQINIYCKMLSLRPKIIFFTWLNWAPPFSIKHKMFFNPVEKFNLLSSDGAIVGNSAAQNILHNKGFNKPIIILPQLGVNVELFYPASMNCHRPTKTIGFIGRLTQEKGIYLLFNAFLKLHHQFNNWNIAFIGGGKEKNHLLKLISQHNLSHHVHIIKTVSHEMIPKFLHKMDILVLPSIDTPTWREQFGHVLIEAMACKIPVIGSSAGAIPEVIDQAGLIFSQGNEDALLAQLQTLMQDEDMRKKFGELGYQRTMAFYSHEAIAERTYRFWNFLQE